MSGLLDGFDFAADDESSVSLDETGEKMTQRNDDWIKIDKGKTVRAAMINYYDIVRNAVYHYRNDNNGANRGATRTKLNEVAEAAIAELTTKLGKPASDLSLIERLDTNDAKIETFQFYYVEQMGDLKGYIIRDGRNEGPEAEALWKTLGEEKRGYSTLLFVYPANPKGEMVLDAEGRERLLKEYQLKKWRFAQKTFELLMGTNGSLLSNGLSLASQDVKLVVTDTKFKTVTPSAAGGAIWRKSPEFMKKVLSEAVPMLGEGLLPFRKMTTAKLREKLGGSVTTGSLTTTAVSDFIDQI